MKEITVFIVALIISGCSGHSQSTCYEGVKSAFPGSNVIIIPGEKYRFIVEKKNGDILYVETMNHSNGDITQKFTAIHGSVE